LRNCHTTKKSEAIASCKEMPVIQVKQHGGQEKNNKKKEGGGGGVAQEVAAPPPAPPPKKKSFRFSNQFNIIDHLWPE
jgi:hypothetical protein